MHTLETLPGDVQQLFVRINTLEENLTRLLDRDREYTGKEIEAKYNITKRTRMNWQKKGTLVPIKKGNKNYYKIN